MEEAANFLIEKMLENERTRCCGNGIPRGIGENGGNGLGRIHMFQLEETRDKKKKSDCFC